MKKFLKVLGAAALVAGFAPYRVEGDKESGTWSVKALLWQASCTPTDDPGKDDITFNFGFQAPSGKDKEEEAHLFSDELTVNYGSPTDGGDVEPETPAAPEAPEAPGAPETPETPETPAAPEGTEEA